MALMGRAYSQALKFGVEMAIPDEALSLRPSPDRSAYSLDLATGERVNARAVIIASGLLGLLPLSGVVTPFLSYGRSSMLANCAAVGGGAVTTCKS